MDRDLKVVPLKPPQAEASVVEILECALELARSGEARSIALVIGLSNGEITSSITSGDGATVHQMNSGLALLQHQVCAAMRGVG